ncbi:hypothetical protein ACFZBU_43180 [Embleya sp. NPDC008237]|uniref:hypothetical protein n=1 Tax=Embleya sp. NPDC008237 TaxID=3363978 RepID=UPI0036EAFB02
MTTTVLTALILAASTGCEEVLPSTPYSEAALRIGPEGRAEVFLLSCSPAGIGRLDVFDVTGKNVWDPETTPRNWSMELPTGGPPIRTVVLGQTPDGAREAIPYRPLEPGRDYHISAGMPGHDGGGSIELTLADLTHAGSVRYQGKNLTEDRFRKAETRACKANKAAAGPSALPASRLG